MIVRQGFQSTPPARGATLRGRLSIHSILISIHAPRKGGDRAFLYAPARHQIFQSTPPARGATGLWSKSMLPSWISIHAPRKGGDVGVAAEGMYRINFNPRPPQGGRRENTRRRFRWLIFQSTPPARGATVIVQHPEKPLDISIHAPRKGGDDRIPTFGVADIRISIHAPRKGGDKNESKNKTNDQNFNPRPPQGGRPKGYQKTETKAKISIHAPRKGGDGQGRGGRQAEIGISIHAPRKGGDPRPSDTAAAPSDFNPRPPQGGRLMT